MQKAYFCKRQKLAVCKPLITGQTSSDLSCSREAINPIHKKTTPLSMPRIHRHISTWTLSLSSPSSWNGQCHSGILIVSFRSVYYDVKPVSRMNVRDERPCSRWRSHNINLQCRAGSIHHEEGNMQTSPTSKTSSNL